MTCARKVPALSPTAGSLSRNRPSCGFLNTAHSLRHCVGPTDARHSGMPQHDSFVCSQACSYPPAPMPRSACGTSDIPRYALPSLAAQSYDSQAPVRSLIPDGRSIISCAVQPNKAGAAVATLHVRATLRPSVAACAIAWAPLTPPGSLLHRHGAAEPRRPRALAVASQRRGVPAPELGRVAPLCAAPERQLASVRIK